MKKYVERSFRVTLPDGSSRRIKVYGKDEKDAEKKLLQKKIEYQQGLITTNSNTLFSKWVKEWLETYKKPKVTEKTYNDELHMINRVFVPRLGALKMSDIKTSHIQYCLNQLTRKSSSYIRKARITINSIMEKALVNGVINRNPALGVEVPKGTAGSRRSLTEKEIELFMQTMEKHPKGDLFAISLACGLRPGEARALTWFNVNLADESITVTQAVESGTRDIKGPKTAAGNRTIPIPEWYVKRLKAMTRNEESPYLFPNTLNQPLSESRYNRGWQSFLREMNLAAGAKTYRNAIIAHAVDQSLSPYYLRHTYATNLAEAGVDIKTAQYLLGHTDIKMTAQIYTHVTPRMIKDAREKLNNLF